MNRWLFLWRRLSRQLWWRASLYAGLGVVAALIATFGAPWVPEALAERFGGGSVEAVLSILASSLLAVATFSLGAMVTAYTSVSSTATPRAAALITEDESTQKSLATFVGAFLYAVVGVTAINASYYGAEGRAILFLFSLVVVALGAFRLLAWINRLTRLARLEHTIERGEASAARALATDAGRRRLGGRSGELTQGDYLCAPTTGYVQNIDVAALQSMAERLDADIQILARPGAFLRRGERLMRISRSGVDPTEQNRLIAAFIMGRARSFEQDARHGLVVLGEIAAKALSPGINDAGTAIAVIGSGVRLLDQWARDAAETPEDESCSRLLIAAVPPHDFIEDLFAPIARHGAGELSVAIRLIKALRSLAAIEGDLGRAAAQAQDRVLALAALRLDDPEERRRLERELALAG